MILEQAVKLNKPVQPQQVRPGGNRFYWWNDEATVLNPALGSPEQSPYLTEAPLAFMSLQLTCKKFYGVLSRYPVFYEVHSSPMVYALKSSRLTVECRSMSSTSPANMIP
jgi:hypothetical protein